MFGKAYVEKLVDGVVRDVKFFKLFKSLNTLQLSQLAPCYVQDSYILEG